MFDLQFWLTFFARFSVTRTGSWVNLESSFQLENGCILICKMCLIESHYHFLSAQTPERAPFGHNSAKVIRANLKRKCWFICFINDIYPHFFGTKLNQLKYYKENVHSAKKKGFHLFVPASFQWKWIINNSIWQKKTLKNDDDKPNLSLWNGHNIPSWVFVYAFLATNFFLKSLLLLIWK